MRFISIFTFLFSAQALSLTNSEFRAARNNGLYFSLIPTLKTKIVNLSLTRSDVEAITEITERFGGEQFEQLSSSYLRKIDSGVTTYLAAKQMFKDGKYGQALNLLKNLLVVKIHLTLISTFLQEVLPLYCVRIKMQKNTSESVLSPQGQIEDPPMISRYLIKKLVTHMILAS